TGGAGFIGTNLARCLIENGQDVLIFDNLSRPGVTRNLEWLRQHYPQQVTVMVADVRDKQALSRAVARVDAVYHLAAQVAVTTSLVSPVEDFLVNALGTLNLLECLREQRTPPPVIYTSTNKVYGDLDKLPLRKNCRRYQPLA